MFSTEASDKSEKAKNKARDKELEAAVLSTMEEDKPPAEVDDLDAANQYVAKGWRVINRNVDMFFTNQKYRAADNKSSVFAYATFYKREGVKIDNEFDFQLKIHLPRTTKKLKLVIEREQDEIKNALSDENLSTTQTSTTTTKGGTKKTTKTTTNTDSKYTAGINYLLSQSKNFTSLIKFSFRIDLPINPAVKLNLQKDIVTEYVTIGLLQNFIFYRQEGFQEISQLSFSRKWDERFQTSLVNSLVWSDDTDVFTLRNNILLYLNVGEEKTLSYSLGANAKLSPTLYYESYDTSVSYRQLVYNKWLYGALTLGMDFLKANDFKDEKFAQLRLEMFFR